MTITIYTVSLFSVLLIFSLILSIQDIKKLSVSIYIQWVSVFAALICHMIFNREGMWLYILSSMICGAFYFAVRKITKGKLGPADVWFGFFQGLFLIPQMIPFCFIIEDVVTLIVINKKFGKKQFAFIPFMSIGVIACFIIQNVTV